MIGVLLLKTLYLGGLKADSSDTQQEISGKNGSA